MAYNPGSLTGAAQLPQQESPYDNLVQNLMQGYKGGMEMRNAPGIAQREAQQGNLKNRLLQEQVTQAEYLTPQRKLEADQQQLMFNALKGAFGGEQAQGQQDPNQLPGQPPEQQAQQPQNMQQDLQASLMQQQGQQPQREAQPGDVNVVRKANPGMEKIDEAYYGNPLVKKYLQDKGYKEKITTRHSPETGQIFETIEYPSGKIEQRAYKIGDKPENITERKEEAKSKVKYREELSNTSNEVQNNLSNIDYAVDLLENNPGAKDVIGPVNQHMTRLFGSQADRELLGQLSTTSGNIALDAAKSIKGAFTGRDLGLINSMKFNPGDTYGQFLGKLKAMKVLNERVSQKVELVDSLMSQGVSKIAAQKAARDKLGFEGVKEQVDNAMGFAKQNKQKQIMAEKTINGKQYVQYSNGEVHLK